ncbi:MAG: DUF342 domain-containing protein [Proteobacteria bacterium]|nr:DUF342 domain-containing protein [Pseudomonadota bacterium]MBU1386514.1 DUF342 domain-containing protein [Pseudomonadota bacterium]MBU1544625.1 DUF342 domain-containing protein [Pseudomonadota bacterium]MBU2481396.1 DUF342 domain-containing protein [Pseudomonadota bacterium]
MQSLLISKGYSADSFDSSLDALDKIRTSVNEPYTVVISSYMMPRMKGDAILKKAGEISPDAQLMLLADTGNLKTLINAINQAGINACLTLPFTDEDFLIQVDECCKHYDTNLKQKNLKRVTARQNKQLFKIASNYKHKTDNFAEQIKKKDTEIRLLESRIKAAGGSLATDKPITITDILAKKNIPVSQKTLYDQFDAIKNEIKTILEAAASGNSLSVRPISYAEAQTFSLLKHQHKDIAGQILPLTCQILFEGKTLSAQKPGTHPALVASYDFNLEVKDIVLDEYFELDLSEDHTKAYIKLKKSDTASMDTTHVRQFLEKHQVINGIQMDQDIAIWLQNASPEDNAFIIAQGKAAKPPKNAQIRYHFPTDFLHAGKINEDGSINFQDRGTIPHVEENAFLAAKIFAEEGTPGITVTGKEIPVGAAEDLTFSAGPGTRISEDGIRIYAAIAGQPQLDALGNISVRPEYHLKGDIGFETGDVDFDGNVIVNGSVKQGFKVKCASLTAKEIQGAEIDINGDLNVSMGIVDTELVKVKGNVQAKFVHNSKINAFGDLIIQKEIIDSKIYLSGACINSNGTIINCEISAKMGIDAGSIGNTSSKPSSLTVGVDENTKLLVAKVDSKLTINNSAINELDQEVKALAQENQDLHAVISKYAYIQDRAQLELKNIEKKMDDLKASGNMAAYQKITKTVEEIRRNAAEAEEKINQGFERQDAIEIERSQKKKRIREFFDENKGFEDEKKRLREFSERQKPLPEVKISGKAESGTRFFAENSALTLKKAVSRCRIKEITKSHGAVNDIKFYDMEITNY